MKGKSSTQAACRMEKEAFFFNIPKKGAMKQKQEWQLKTFIVIVYKLA